jgi:hypothetical protein
MDALLVLFHKGRGQPTNMKGGRASNASQLRHTLCQASETSRALQRGPNNLTEFDAVRSSP